MRTLFIELKNGGLFKLGNGSHLIGIQYGELAIDGMSVTDFCNYDCANRDEAILSDARVLATAIAKRLDGESEGPILYVRDWRSAAAVAENPVSEK